MMPKFHINELIRIVLSLACGVHQRNVEGFPEARSTLGAQFLEFGWLGVQYIIDAISLL
jgi:hypothetical protein